jgi:uncharacterized membrane protein
MSLQKSNQKILSTLNNAEEIFEIKEELAKKVTMAYIFISLIFLVIYIISIWSSSTSSTILGALCSWTCSSLLVASIIYGLSISGYGMIYGYGFSFLTLLISCSISSGAIMNR